VSDTSPPFRAYNGDDAYIFACYSHSDTERVYSELARLRLEGFNIWYDEGVAVGSTGFQYLKEVFIGCSVGRFRFSRCKFTAQ